MISVDFRGGRRSLEAPKLSRQWKSMADMTGRITPTLTKPAVPARARTPTSYRSSTPHRNHSPVRHGKPYCVPTTAGGWASTGQMLDASHHKDQLTRFSPIWKAPMIF